MSFNLKTADAAYLGFGLYWAWMSVTFFGPTIYADYPSIGTMVKELWIWFSASATMVRLVHLALRKRIPYLSENRPLFRIALTTSVVGALLVPLGTFDPNVLIGQAPLWSVVGALLCGASACWGSIMWGEVFTGKDTESAFVLVTGSYSLSCCVHFAVTALPQPFAIVLDALLLVLTYVCMDVCRRGRQDSPLSRIAKPTPRITPLIAIPLVAIFVYASCGEVFHTFLSLPGSTADLYSMGSWYTLGGGVGTAALLLFVLAVKGLTGRTNEFFYLYAVLIFMAVGVMLPTIFPVSPLIAYAVFGAAFWCFRCIVWTYSVKLSTDLKILPLYVFAIGSLMFLLAILLGSPVVHAVSDSMHLGDMAWSTVAIIMLFFIMLIALALSFGRKTLWGLLPVPKLPVEDVGLESLLRERYILTTRECEVAMLLARGRNLPYIQEKLYISEGTAKSHMKNIYRKMGVHGKQEFLDAVEEAEGIRS